MFLLLVPMVWISYLSLSQCLNCLFSKSNFNYHQKNDVPIDMSPFSSMLWTFPFLLDYSHWCTNTPHHPPFLNKIFPWSYHTIFLFLFFFYKFLKNLPVYLSVYRNIFFLKSISPSIKLLLTGSLVTFTFQIQWSFLHPHFSWLIISIWHNW